LGETSYFEEVDGYMKTIISVIIIVVLVLVLGTSQVAIAEIDSNSIINNGVQYYIQTDKSVYELGENVNILYRVSNLTNENIILQSVLDDPLAYYDFKITQNDNRIWIYPYVSSVLGLTGIFFDPHESKEFQTVWNMMNDNGTFWPTDDFFVSTGVYNVLGQVALFPTDQRIPVSVSIDIVLEPSTLLLFGAGFIGLFLKTGRK
jgi:hypothetical protein